VKMIGPEIKVPDWTFRLKRRTSIARAIRRGQGDTVFEQSGTSLPTAALLGDSFGDALASVLCDAFSRLHYDFTTMNGPNPRLVAEERPDVVVLILVERNLWRLVNQ